MNSSTIRSVRLTVVVAVAVLGVLPKNWLIASQTQQVSDSRDHYQRGHTRLLTFVGWSKDSARLLSYSWDDAAIRLWNVQDGRVIAELNLPHVGEAPTVNREVGIVVTRVDRTTIHLTDASTGELLWRISRDEPQRSSPDGRFTAEGGGYDDYQIRIINAHTGQLVRALSGHPGIVYSLAFSADGELLASGNGDYTVTIRDVGSGVIKSVLRGHNGPVKSVIFSPNGKLLASGGDDRTVRLWDITSSEPRHVLKGFTYSVRALAFSPDARLLATGGMEPTIRLWNVEDGRLLQAIDTYGERKSGAKTFYYGGNVGALAFSPSGEIIASGCDDGSLILWSATTGKPIRAEIRRGGDDLHSIRFGTESGWEWVSSGGGKSGTVLRTAARRRVSLRGEAAEYVWALSLSPNGRRIGTGTIGGQIAVWDAWTGHHLRMINTEHTVLAIAFSPNTQLIAAGGEDQTIRLWDAATGKLLWNAAQLGPK